MLDGVLQDLRYALRALRRSPGFAAAAILSLALGIGANTAIFSLIDAVILKSLPVRHPEELLQVMMGKQSYVGFTNPTWEHLRDRQDVFSGIFAYGRWGFNLAAGGSAFGAWKLCVRTVFRHVGRPRGTRSNSDSCRRYARLRWKRGAEL
jgi:putative ABC transport system permease protein